MGIPVIGTNGRFPGLFVQVPEDFSLLFFCFCTCPWFFFRMGQKKERVLLVGKEWLCLFFGGGGEGDGRTDCFLQIFFPNPFVSLMQPKRQKVEPFLKKKKKKSFFLLLFLFQRQNGKSCSTSSGRDEAGFPSGMCKGCRLGDSPVSNRGLCPPRSGSRCRDINWISHLCPGRET